MNAPDTSGTEPPASQAVVEIRDHMLRQVRESYASNAGEDVTINQIAVSALGVAVLFASVSGEPVVAPLPDRQFVFFLHIIASFWQTNNITESRE